MRPIPVAQYLDRLAEIPPVAVMRALAMAQGADQPLDGEARAAEEAARDAAYLRGVGEGEGRAAAAHERLLAEERDAADARLRDAQARWAAEWGARLAQGLDVGLDALGERLADQVGRLLEPFVEGRVLERAVAELRGALARLLVGAPGAGARVSGPPELLAALRESAAATAAVIEFVEADGIDVRIVAADTVIESRLSAWMERLREAVA